MTDEDAPFGLRFYEALERSGNGTYITGRMSYADVQRLKAAGRDEVVHLFRGSGYALVQRMKTDSPEELAALLAHQAEQASRNTAALSIVCAGVALLGR